MADSMYKQAVRQHLALRQQEDSAHPVVLVHQHQAALEHQQHQPALAAGQDLQRRRPLEILDLDLVAKRLHQQHHNH